MSGKQNGWVWWFTAGYLLVVIAAAMAVAAACYMFWESRTGSYRDVLTAAYENRAKFRLVELAGVAAPVGLAAGALFGVVAALLVMARKRLGLYLSLLAPLCTVVGLYAGRRAIGVVEGSQYEDTLYVRLFRLGWVPLAVFSALAFAFIVFGLIRTRSSAAHDMRG